MSIAKLFCDLICFARGDLVHTRGRGKVRHDDASSRRASRMSATPRVECWPPAAWLTQRGRDCACECGVPQFKPGASAFSIQTTGERFADVRRTAIICQAWLLSLVGVSRGLLVPMPMASSGCGRSAGLNRRRGRMVDVLEVLRDGRVGRVRTGLCVS